MDTSGPANESHPKQRVGSTWRRRAALLCLAVFSITLTTALCIIGLECVCYLSDSHPEKFDYEYSKKELLVSYQSVVMPSSGVPLHTMPANIHYHGPAPWEGRTMFEPDFVTDITTDEWGFFSPVSYKELTQEAPDEYRIIVVGGSGAQGHGASDLESTFARRLEHKLNQDSGVQQSGRKVRVINLAIAGQFAELNEIILHRFGHALSPDMIVLYNGVNDLAQVTFSNLPMYMNTYADATLEREFAWTASEVSPDYVKFLNDRFPYLGRKYRLFHWLGKKLTPAHYEEQKERLRIEYLARWGILEDPSDIEHVERVMEFLDFQKRTPSLPGHERKPTGFNDIGEEIYKKVPLESFVRSVKGIKRDFDGIPVVVAWQAIGVSTQHTPDGPRIENSLLYDNWFDIDDVYTRFFEDEKKQLQGYVNDDWWFFEVDQRIEERVAKGIAPKLHGASIGAHLDDLGHQVVADVLYDEIKPIVLDKLGDRATPNLEGVRTAGKNALGEALK